MIRTPDVIPVSAVEYAALPPSPDWTGPCYRIVDEAPPVRPYTREEIAVLRRSPEWREAATDDADDACEALRQWELSAYEDPAETRAFAAYRLDDDLDDADC